MRAHRFIVPTLFLLAVLVARAEPTPLTTGGFAFDVEVKVPVPPARAFDAFTRETLAWWDHTFSEHPKSLSFDARPGGGFVERFDEAGNGAWHATIIYADRPKRLRFTGPLGLSGHAIEAAHTLDFEPVEGGTLVKLSVHAAGEYDKAWPTIVEGVWRHFLVERFLPYVTAHPAGPGPDPAPAAIDATNPLVASALAYRAAKKTNDLDDQRALLAPGARMRFENLDDPGSEIVAGDGGGDPWADWDRFFRSASTVEAAEVKGRRVQFTVSEINDWYRLVERPASRYFMSYDFDAEGRITGVLVHSIPGEAKTPDRLADFKTWAGKNRPGLVEKLMPSGKLDPALEKAKLWKASLLEWRKSAGLAVPTSMP